jgi:hypothetical protein
MQRAAVSRRAAASEDGEGRESARAAYRRALKYGRAPSRYGRTPGREWHIVAPARDARRRDPVLRVVSH